MDKPVNLDDLCMARDLLLQAEELIDAAVAELRSLRDENELLKAEVGSLKFAHGINAQLAAARELVKALESVAHAIILSEDVDAALAQCRAKGLGEEGR